MNNLTRPKNFHGQLDNDINFKPDGITATRRSKYFIIRLYGLWLLWSY